jgi:hypothetical protein
MATASPDRYYLMGDEDAGVGLHCRDCDTGGIPVIYYGYGYPDPAIPVTQSIEALLSAARQHDAEHPAADAKESS